MIRDGAACSTPARRTEAGSQLLRLALAHHFNTKPSAWQIGRAANGARVVTIGPGPLPALSVTHSGDWLAVAVAPEGSIGVDIERPAPRNYAGIARHLGWPESLWESGSEPAQDDFLHVWTLWEALFKATPESSFDELRAALAGMVGIRPGRASAIESPDWSGRSWRGMDGCWLSVVARPAQPVESRLRRVDRLADDVDSARIQTITAPEGVFSS